MIYGFLAQFLKFFYSFFNNLSLFRSHTLPTPYIENNNLCETVDVMRQAEKEVGLYLVSTLFLLQNFTRA